MEKNMEVKSSLHISIPSSLLKTLNELSVENKKSRNQIIAELLEQWIEDQEDIKLAENVLNNIKSGKTKTVSWAKMKDSLGW